MGILFNYFSGLSEGSLIDRTILVSLNRVVDKKVDGHWVNIASAINGYEGVFIPWVERFISCYEVSPEEDILSTKFNGCYLARIFDIYNNKRGFHIHIGTDISMAGEWSKYVENSDNIREVILFRPDYKTEFARYEIELWGLISTIGKCYEIKVKCDFEANEKTGKNDYKEVRFISMEEVKALTSETIP